MLGLALGAGIYGVVGPTRSVTQTESGAVTQTVTNALTTSTSTRTVTQAFTSTSTALQNQTETSTTSVTQYVISTFTLSSTRLVTETVTQTANRTTTETATLTETETVTAATIGGALASNSGTGTASSQPFTAPEPEEKIVLDLAATGPVSDVNATWNIYQVGQPSPVCSGGVIGQQGTFTDYCYNLTVNYNYYIQVAASNATWSVTVYEVVG